MPRQPQYQFTDLRLFGFDSEFALLLVQHAEVDGYSGTVSRSAMPPAELVAEWKKARTLRRSRSRRNFFASARFTNGSSLARATADWRHELLVDP